MNYLYPLLIPGLLLPGISFLHAADADPQRISTAFSQPTPVIHKTVRMDFVLGQALFEKLWVSSPASTRSSDGLGPLYNARSCAQCHIRNGRGIIGHDPEKVHTSLIARIEQPESLEKNIYGRQLQTRAIAGMVAEGRIGVRYNSKILVLSDGLEVTLQNPEFTLNDLQYGHMPETNGLSFRMAPPLIGMGLLDSIPAKHIESLADPLDTNGDGISGQVSRVYSYAKNAMAIGRFGWKAEQPDILQQNNIALRNDLGLSSRMFQQPWGDCSELQALCRNAPHGDNPDKNGIEINDEMLGLLATYTTSLAVPAQRNRDNQDVIAGEAIFREIGCASCHSDSYIIRAIGENKPAIPWTDLLLHDMGDGLADKKPGTNPHGREWRTQPLWGLGLTQRIEPDAGFLHDGRARTVLEAILWHGGEAKVSRNRVIDLNTQPRKQLLKFLESL